MNGGKTRIKIAKIKNEKTAITKNNEINLGSFNLFWIWLHILQTIFEITKEQIIKSMKSLNIHMINDVIKITANLKYDWLLNLDNILLLLRIS